MFSINAPLTISLADVSTRPISLDASHRYRPESEDSALWIIRDARCSSLLYTILYLLLLLYISLTSLNQRNVAIGLPGEISHSITVLFPADTVFSCRADSSSGALPTEIIKQCMWTV